MAAPPAAAAAVGCYPGPAAAELSAGVVRAAFAAFGAGGKKSSAGAVVGSALASLVAEPDDDGLSLLPALLVAITTRAAAGPVGLGDGGASAGGAAEPLPELGEQQLHAIRTLQYLVCRSNFVRLALLGGSGRGPARPVGPGARSLLEAVLPQATRLRTTIFATLHDQAPKLLVAVPSDPVVVGSLTATLKIISELLAASSPSSDETLFDPVFTGVCPISAVVRSSPLHASNPPFVYRR